MENVEQVSYEVIKQHILTASPSEERPAVLLTYAQSVDGLISTFRSPLPLSSRESMVFTHALRATHDAIIVGISTLEIDDPLLTTRLVQANIDGTRPVNQPVPVVLDTYLRITLPKRLLNRPRDYPQATIFTTSLSSAARREELKAQGVNVVVVDKVESGVCFMQVLRTLRKMGIKRVMVEGGAAIIQTVLTEDIKPDTVAVTICPRYQLTGTRPFFSPAQAKSPELLLGNPVYKQFGADVVLISSQVKPASRL